MIAFQRQGNPLQSVLMGLLVGSGGTLATTQLSFTLMPVSDHYTLIQPYASMSSQSAFGKTESVPLNNGRMQRDVTALIKSVSAGLPPNYRFIAQKQ